jgi:LysM repeat protein
MGINVADLIAANPQLWNPNLIYAGQVINLPGAGTYYNGYSNYGTNYGAYGSPNMYTVQWGDSLRNIATRYGTSVENIMALNPQIRDRHWIYAGQVIRVY